MEHEKKRPIIEPIVEPEKKRSIIEPIVKHEKEDVIIEPIVKKSKKEDELSNTEVFINGNDIFILPKHKDDVSESIDENNITYYDRENDKIMKEGVDIHNEKGVDPIFVRHARKKD